MDVTSLLLFSMLLQRWTMNFTEPSYDCFIAPPQANNSTKTISFLIKICPKSKNRPEHFALTVFVVNSNQIGEVAERLNAPVLKTNKVPEPFVGSDPHLYHFPYS